MEELLRAAYARYSVHDYASSLSLLRQAASTPSTNAWKPGPALSVSSNQVLLRSVYVEGGPSVERLAEYGRALIALEREHPELRCGAAEFPCDPVLAYNYSVSMYLAASPVQALRGLLWLFGRLEQLPVSFLWHFTILFGSVLRELAPDRALSLLKQVEAQVLRAFRGWSPTADDEAQLYGRVPEVRAMFACQRALSLLHVADRGREYSVARMELEAFLQSADWAEADVIARPHLFSLLTQLLLLNGQDARLQSLLRVASRTSDVPPGSVGVVRQLHTWMLSRASKLDSAAFAMAKWLPHAGVAGEPLVEAAVLYNCAVQYVLARKWTAAFDVLCDILPAKSSDCLVWLRLADCCIQDHNQRRQASLARALDDGLRWRAVLGLGSRLAQAELDEEEAAGSEKMAATTDGEALTPAAPSAWKKKAAKSSTTPSKSASLEPPTLSLGFAVQCLRTALSLLGTDVFRDPHRRASRAGVHYTRLPSDVRILRAYLLVNLAYVHLHLRDYTSALHYAREALARKDFLTPTMLDATVQYAVEALVRLNRLQEASKLLLAHAAELKRSVSTILNLSMVHFLRKELDKADELRKVAESMDPRHPDVIRLSLFYYFHSKK